MAQRGSSTGAAAQVSVQERVKIAVEAYIYSYPIVLNYKLLYDAVANSRLNAFQHERLLTDASFTAVVTPNEDTLYSRAWLDLRTEPIVLSVPEVPAPRYYSMQLVDIYTHNFAIFGSSTKGRSAGNYLITGPYWTGDTPKGINAVYQSEGEFVFVLGRTESLKKSDPEDLKRVHEIQNAYTLTPYSQFTGSAPPKPKEMPVFPVFDESKVGTVDAFVYSNFLLQFVDIDESEKELFERFKIVGVGPGLTVDSTLRAAINEGVKKALATVAGLQQSIGKPKAFTINPPPFGTRKELMISPRSESKPYLRRALSAHIGLYGLSPSEALYPQTTCDTEDRDLNGDYNYVVHFNSDQLPQVKAFWSITMYDAKTKGFVHNPINRYSVGLHTEGLSYGDDGSLTIYIQKDSPGQDKESNWLPAPNGPFYVVMRLYGPTESTLKSPSISLALTRSPK